MILKAAILEKFKELNEFLKELHGEPKKEDLTPLLFRTEISSAASLAVIWRSSNRDLTISLVSTMGACSFAASNSAAPIKTVALSFNDDLPQVQVMANMVKACQLVNLIPDGTEFPP